MIRISLILALMGVFCSLTELGYSQGVAINTDGSNADNSAMLDVQSTSAGILIPRLTQAQRNSIASPATGLMVFQTDNTQGFYYNAGTSAAPSWIKLSVPTDNFEDADSDVTNEIQSLTISGHDITLSNGGGTVTVPDNVNDADAVVGNEFQSLSISGHTVSLSDGGGSVTVPDNNTTYAAGNQLSLSGTTFNVNEGAGSGLDADLLDGHQWSEIVGANGWIDDGSVIRLETSSDNVGIGTSSPQVQLHLTEDLQIGTDGLAVNHLLTSWTENGYETNFFFRETPTHAMGMRYNATDNKLYLDRYPNQATPVPAIAIQRDAAIVEMEATLDMQANQIQDLACDGGSTDAASCGWVNANDDNTTYAAGTGLSLSGTTFSNTGDLSSSNELQNLSISGHNLTLSNGGGTITLPDNNTTYFAGTGLSLSGTTFTNTGDLSNTNEIQNLTSVLGQGNSAGTQQITSLACDGGSTDAASCGWVSEENNLWVLSANMCYSPDDLWVHGGSSTGVLTGDDEDYTASLPFSVLIDGTSYNTIGICTNGFIEFGGVSSSSYTNTCLPSSSHSKPLVAGYWDDLRTTGNAIRYGYVGNSPNRVYIVDFECETYTGSNEVSFQIQIHERSGMINVKYRNTMAPAANGQSATIGFQGVGGSSATAYPITCNGKVLDDNRDDSEGWSVCPVR